MKTKEELNALKEEAETLNKKLHELTEEELAQVSGGSVDMFSREAARPQAGESFYPCQKADASASAFFVWRLKA